MNTAVKKKTAGTYMLAVVIHVFLIITTLAMILPYLSMFGTAVKSPQAAMSTLGLFPESWADFSMASFQESLIRYNFINNIKNSAIVSAAVVILCTLVASLTGYALSRARGLYFRAYAVLLLLFQMFPAVLLMIPLYQMYTTFQITDTLLAVIISYTTTNLSFSTFMLRGFFDTIPREIEEAAIIDGCSKFGGYYRMVLPLSLPGIATVAIFVLLGSWNEFMLANLFLRKSAVMTMTVGLQAFIAENATNWPALMAASTTATIPTVLFLIFAQRYLIDGMTAGAVKG